MDQISLEIGIILLSTTKYLMGAGIAFSYKLGILEGFLTSTIGGILGVAIYLFIFDKTESNIGKKRKRRRISFLRFLARIRSSYGLVGISILSPLVLSIPLGCFLARSFESNNKKILAYMSAGVIAWGVLIFGIKYIFDIDLFRQLQ
jgi:hypothetical protein